MAEFNDFLNLISEAKKEIEETSILPKSTVKEDAIFSFFESINISLNPAEEIVEHPQIVEQEIVEQKIEPIVEKLDLTDPTQYTKLFKTNTDHFSQPNVPKVDPNFKALTDKVKYMEDWLTKISMAGPGSGEVNLRWLDDIDRSSIFSGRYLRYNDISKKFEFAEVNPHDIVFNTALVTTSTYTINDSDYYVGVNCGVATTITLPLVPNSGRMLIIKDESGNAGINPITVAGTVDNDPGGFIIQINNGGVQLIYRNGWRII